MAIGKYRLLTRIGETRDEIQWNDYNVEKIVPDATLISGSLRNKIREIFPVSDMYERYFISKSNTPPDSDIQIVNISSTETPVYIYSPTNNNHISIYSEAKNIFFNNNSRSMFDNVYLADASFISSFNSARLFNASRMFDRSYLDTFDFSWFAQGTSTINNMSYMFRRNYLENISFDNIDTSNVTDMSYMLAGERLVDPGGTYIEGPSFTEIDISSFNTSKLENVSGMFEYCENLKSINMLNLDISKITDCTDMFNSCIGLTTIICSSEVEDWIRTNEINMGLPRGADVINFLRS